MTRKPVSSVVATGLLTVFLLAPEATRGELPLWDRWTRQLDTLERQLQEGNWESCGKTARDLSEEIADHSGGTMGYLRAQGDHFDGAQVGQGLIAEAIALGRSVAYLALAEAAQGRWDQARWHWYLAQNLDSRWRTEDLSRYREAGAFLAQHRIKPAAEQYPETDVIDPVIPEGGHRSRFREPERTKVVYPKRPQDLASRDRFSHAIFVQVTVEQDGTVTQPVVVDAPMYPGLIYEALEAMSSWRYRPATLDGKAVPFRYIVPIVFADDRPEQSAVFF
jgi:Gram-negative bacterial TonB protein C-terminal